MKRFFILLLICPVLLFTGAEQLAAQGFTDILGNNGRIGVGFVATHLDGLNESTSAGPGGELFYSFDLNDNIFVAAGLGFYTVNDELLKATALRQTLFPSVDLKIGYAFLGTAGFSPYIYGGLHAFGTKQTIIAIDNTQDLGFDGSIFAGGGLQLAISDNLNFFLNGDYRYVATSTAAVKPKYWTAHAGISYSLSPRKRTREEIEFPVDDNELALEELFQSGGTTSDSNARSSSTGDAALDALFNTAGKPADDGSVATSDQVALDELFGGQTAESGGQEDDADAISMLFEGEESAAGNGAYDNTEVGQLMARVQSLKDEIAVRDREIDDLKDKVQRNEMAIAQFSRGVAGQYAGIDGAFGEVTAGNYTQLYQNALQKHYNRQYSEAIREFTMLLNAMPEHKLASNCQYWIGESYNAMGDYRNAIDAFTAVLDFGSSYKYDDALIMNGLIYMKLGNKSSARENFQQLVSKYPDSEYAPKAMRYLGRL
ncbi:tetratricopeptide repeat protein [bacterium]|nr:tetratricopeptide repeat protein [bacterium]